jgi:hypothetical protein
VTNSTYGGKLPLGSARATETIDQLLGLSPTATSEAVSSLFAF